MSAAILKRLRHILCAAPIVALLLVSVPALADPPSRIGRINFMQGDVSFFMNRDEGWRKAQVNFPVTSENSLWTQNGGRAEVRVGASALRIDDGSVLDFVRLQDDQTQAFLQRGTLSLRLRADEADDGPDRRGDSGNVRVETAQGQFAFSRDGRYRVDALPERGETRVSVYAGRARFESGDNRVSIDAGKSLVVRGTANTTDFHFENATESAFDRWADARDQNWNHIHVRYVQERAVSPYMTGYEDLDQYGNWSDDPEYGRLWTPRVVVSGWAPYRYGHWVDVAPWGWTWVDDAAWGFAPFHYGRWVYVSAHSRWAWWPGPYVRRPVYAPALVAWFNRSGTSISISSGPSVGWCPLAPREHYLPRYSNNPIYIRNINYVTNNVTVINPPARYANQLPGATVVNNNVFFAGKPIGRNIVPVPPAIIAAQKPGSGVEYGPHFNRVESGNVRRDHRPEEHRPLPIFAPPAPAAPLPPAAAPRVRYQPSPVRPAEAVQPIGVPTRTPATSDDGARANRPRLHNERPAIERAPVQPAAGNAVERAERGAAPIRQQQNAGEPRSAPRPHVAPVHEGKPPTNANPAPVAKEPKAEVHNKPREVEK